MNSPAQEMQQENKICLVPLQLHGVTCVVICSWTVQATRLLFKQEDCFCTTLPEKKIPSPHSGHRCVGLAAYNKKNYLD